MILFRTKQIVYRNDDYQLIRIYWNSKKKIVNAAIKTYRGYHKSSNFLLF